MNTTAARYQNLSINQTKLSGQCGRLKCCLNYELDTYMDALAVFPDNADTIETTQGMAYLQKRDIFKNLMWYGYKNSNKQYPLTIVRVKEIVRLNKEGKKPDELQPVELETSANKAGLKVDIGFVNDVGQLSLKSLERSNKKRKGGSRPQQAGGGSQPRSNQPRTAQPKSSQPQQPKSQGQSPKQQGQPPKQQGQSRQQGQPPKQQGQRPERQGQRPERQPQRPRNPQREKKDPDNTAQ